MGLHRPDTREQKHDLLTNIRRFCNSFLLLWKKLTSTVLLMLTFSFWCLDFHKCTHTGLRVYTHTHTRTNSGTLKNTLTHTQTHTPIHKHTHRQTNTHTHIHTNTHSHICHVSNTSLDVMRAVSWATAHNNMRVCVHMCMFACMQNRVCGPKKLISPSNNSLYRTHTHSPSRP